MAVGERVLRIELNRRGVIAQSLGVLLKIVLGTTPTIVVLRTGRIQRDRARKFLNSGIVLTEVIISKSATVEGSCELRV